MVTYICSYVSSKSELKTRGLSHLKRIATEGCSVLLQEGERRTLVEQTSVQILRRDVTAGELSSGVQ